MNNKSLVSVIMPVFNAEQYVLEAAMSILDQTYAEIEFIIVDDGSTDSSIEKIAALRDDRITVLTNANNMGLAACLNKAIQHASGKFIARMDADDVSLPTRIEQQVGKLNEDPGIFLLGSGLQYFNFSSFKNFFPETHDMCKAKLLFNVCFGHSSLIFRREVFDRTENLYDPLLKQYSEDYELYSRLVDRYRFGNLPEMLLRYRTFPPVEKRFAENERKKNSRMVRRGILKAMGVDASEKELDVHSVASDFNKLNALKFNEIASWFKHLYECNLSSGYFNSKALAETLTEQFFLLAYHNAHLRIGTRTLYKMLELPNQYEIPIDLLAKYEAKRFLTVFN